MGAAPRSPAGAEAAAAARSPLGMFVVNLDRCGDRWNAVRRHFGDLPWPLYRVPALDAKQSREAVLACRGQAIVVPPDGVGWNPYRQRVFSLVEEACLCSHIAAWKQFLQSGHDYALIMEDDAEPYGDFRAAVTALLEDPCVDIVKLEGIPCEGGRLAIAIRRLDEKHTLVRSLRPHSGGAAYMLTRRAAEHLCAAIGQLPVPVDDFLWSQGTHGLDVAHVSPWLVMQSGAASTMLIGRKANRHVKRRDPYHLVDQLVRRGVLRFQLWWNALQGRPWKLLMARNHRWLPDGYGPQVK